MSVLYSKAIFLFSWRFPLSLDQATVLNNLSFFIVMFSFFVILWPWSSSLAAMIRNYSTFRLNHHETFPSILLSSRKWVHTNIPLFRTELYPDTFTYWSDHTGWARDFSSNLTLSYKFNLSVIERWLIFIISTNWYPPYCCISQGSTATNKNCDRVFSYIVILLILTHPCVCPSVVCQFFMLLGNTGPQVIC